MALTPEQQAQADIMAEAMRQALNPGVNDRLVTQQRPPALPEQVIECVSPSGAHFDAIIVPSRTYPNGRVVRLDNYRYPQPADDTSPTAAAKYREKYACHDGPERFQFPRGMTLIHEGGEMHGQFTTDAKMLITQSTFLRDLREYNGKPLDPTIRADRQAALRKFRDEQERETARFLREQTAVEDPAPAPQNAPQK